jgi:hypothetical protein
MPVVLFAGVSKLPNGLFTTAVVTFTWICCGELTAPGAVTVMTPLVAPGANVTWNVPTPFPDVGLTEIKGWFDEAVQATAEPLVKVIEIVCGLVTNVPLTP